MNVEDSLILMSDEIYACEKGVVMPVPKLQMSLRSQEKFMGESSSIGSADYQIYPSIRLPLS
jgi:hypothetical protein